jgi:hypothetical protein
MKITDKCGFQSQIQEQGSHPMNLEAFSKSFIEFTINEAVPMKALELDLL